MSWLLLALGAVSLFFVANAFLPVRRDVRAVERFLAVVWRDHRGLPHGPEVTDPVVDVDPSAEGPVAPTVAG